MSPPTLFQVPPLTAQELEFFKQLFSSDLAVTIRAAEVVASIKAKFAQASALPAPSPLSAGVNVT